MQKMIIIGPKYFYSSLNILVYSVLDNNKYNFCEKIFFKETPITKPNQERV